MDNHAKSDAHADNSRPRFADARAILEQLVAFPTVSRNSNMELIDYIYEYLSGYGLNPYLTFNRERNKANLYAVIGPEGKSGIALSGHTDVVPVDGQDWRRDPWVVSEADGRLYGRGTSDMKGFIAVALAQVPDMIARNLARPIHLCFSYDEEVGCVGIRRLLDYLVTRTDRPSACIVGEPTRMQVINGHKGKLSARCRVRGFACHSALAPHGVNAVEYAARLITRLVVLAQSKRKRGPFDHAFDVPYTTVHTGTVQGGTTVNIVPSECQFDFEFRNLPADDPERLFTAIKEYARTELEPEMRAVAPQTGFDWTERARFPGLDTPPNETVVRLVQGLLGTAILGKVSFGTEGGLFHEAGIPAAVCGPGSIEQAHKPDEYIEIEQLKMCGEFIRRLIDDSAA
ncbi:MAG: acetylornithine deacetylase [Gammaproteobacteria bacterium]|nr:acetylornithine deacetylase [Gammaproteobacteria bacterium]